MILITNVFSLIEILRKTASFDECLPQKPQILAKNGLKNEKNRKTESSVF